MFLTNTYMSKKNTQLFIINGSSYNYILVLRFTRGRKRWINGSQNDSTF